MNLRVCTIVLIVAISFSCSSSKTTAPPGMIAVDMNTSNGDKRLYVDETEVTNAQFSTFVKATGYVTIAEKAFTLQFMKEGVLIDSVVSAGSLVFKPTEGPVSLNDFTQWWEWKEGAFWAAPNGPDSNIKGLENHPVVHVSYTDAIAYAQWAGKRLPTEKEWEYIAKGGGQNTYAWGNTNADEAASKANFWQGLFPFKNNLEDGYSGTAPVKSYKPNGYGIYDMSGNVWEWCSSETGEAIVKGGSFLCNDSYCSGFRIDSRMPNDKESSLNHTGFRLVKEVHSPH